MTLQIVLKYYNEERRLQYYECVLTEAKNNKLKLISKVNKLIF